MLDYFSWFSAPFQPDTGVASADDTGSMSSAPSATRARTVVLGLHWNHDCQRVMSAAWGCIYSGVPRLASSFLEEKAADRYARCM
jgi:hypothetical protein